MKKHFVVPRSPAARALWLRDRRALKMAESAHAYVRGNTRQFYTWLESEQGHAIPAGPEIWICGDCHIGNLGPVSDATGKVGVEIRDLDQTVIGNPSHDLVRLGLSLAMAARSSDLPGVTTARMLEACMVGYRHALTGRSRRSEQPDIIAPTYKHALRRRWRHLARERIDNPTPTIPLGEKFWPLRKAERDALQAMFEQEDLRELLTKLEHRDSAAEVRLLDAAYWVKGCSSLGGLRFVALASVGDPRHDSTGRNLCMVDIKQAGPAAAPRSADATMPRDNAQRVVAGARHLSPSLGSRMLATRFLDTAVFVRELLPQDIKFNLEQLNANQAVGVAQYLAAVVGRAHGRQMTPALRREWLAELNRAHSKRLEAPSWLWSSVVDLSARHEAAYLEHCRKFALGVSD